MSHTIYLQTDRENHNDFTFDLDTRVDLSEGSWGCAVVELSLIKEFSASAGSVYLTSNFVDASLVNDHSLNVLRGVTDRRAKIYNLLYVPVNVSELNYLHFKLVTSTGALWKPNAMRPQHAGTMMMLHFKRIH